MGLRNVYRCLLGLALPLLAPSLAAEPPQVRLETTLGEIVLALEPQAAPKTVANFLAYVEDGYYNGLTFHRVIENFMIQGGGFTAEGERRPARDPVENESNNGLRNERGRIAMARTSDPHSATAQFFINVVDNAFLDRENARDGWGYCVFGRVVSGMEVVDKIRAVPTSASGAMRDQPQAPVIIERASLVPPG